MTFQTPGMLWLLLVLPLAVLAYIFLLRRQKRSALRFASLGLVKEALGPGQKFRRHLPPAVFLVAMGLAVFSIARPAAVITLPSQRETIVLAMDVSGSMRATDVDPRRISAAQAAARDFVKDQPRTARIGVVAFSSTAMTVQQPTLNREDVIAAVERLQPQRFTAVGSGILVALQNIFPGASFDEESPRSLPSTQGAPLGGDTQVEQQPFMPVPPGSYTSAVIILLSDGQTNVGADPVKAAHAAADRGVRVFTVGFGSDQGGVVDFEGRSVYVQLDEETLKKIADITRGAYFRAGSQAELNEIYKTLTTKLIMETQQTEITALFAAAAAIMAVIAAALSMMWAGRIA
ncbi:MAG: VWA domain-containing protein [Rhodospirillaceae bacterium]|nr:VWA domain-containing protein [Rhodospirillaceae bacterium]